ncbi:hypothetical protein HY029_05665 [Candidatus Gottesmanbacteria bacterium]|nr:hypothetical protein [Candidatus Gottesmanbacteria bacterium]
MKKIIALLTSSSIFFLSASISFADDSTTINIVKPDIIKITNFGTLIGGIVGIALVLAAIFAFIYLIWGGIQWITSGGDKAGVEAAQHRIQAALLGLLIVASTWALFSVMGSILGIDIFHLKLPVLGTG